jgi:hypothetical protein
MLLLSARHACFISSFWIGVDVDLNTAAHGLARLGWGVGWGFGSNISASNLLQVYCAAGAWLWLERVITDVFFGGYKGGEIYWLAIHSNQRTQRMLDPQL